MQRRNTGMDLVFHCFFTLKEKRLTTERVEIAIHLNSQARVFRSSLLGSFSKGFRPAEGHGCRGSAGAGRKAVPLCQRGRAA
ncbi:hypothetical protein CHARACLAT_017094 [Characodon lateralis]|uniref:Uncharacterized protein n=1 Tax=Characodon lateralis TaxID=208331 RepID=A0ABU7E161_9TELE|nr:hypothetical protein [Characodon lateralis]